MSARKRDTTSTPTGARVIDGQSIARAIEDEAATEVEELIAAGVVPHLATVQVGQDPATDLYIRNQKRRFRRLGIRFTHLSLDAQTGEAGLIAHIQSLNANPTITGIMITTPFPGEVAPEAVREAVDPDKDVEGLTPTNMGNLIYDRGGVGPCTALAVLEILESTGTPREGARAVVVGHSDTVGKPLTLCLLRDLATTTTCHIATRDLASETRAADILVVAVGKPDLITADMVKEGAVVIDVGINEIKGKGIVGDVEFEGVSKRASWISPVPGGVGPVTVAMLAKNTVICARRRLPPGPA